ncbi:sensor histidine kinase [Actomonas aquatica]|uniref:histidine kinase n=1 Tax=Actomonas aquatica TaxID=2866162 RepID=A0ABZ1C6G6_9BACT|nr:sensor histidine kinase [Opitutus sp. WL0086]WRQ87046.1 sensor histidine kinase [Opitutus sp. WL0086]
MPRSLSSRQVQWTALLAAALLLLALVAVVAWPVRRELQAQVLEREATAVAAVARLQRDLGVARIERLGVEATVDDVFEALLESSRLEGVAAIQLYDASGRAARELPLEAYVDALATADQVSRATARFHVGSPPAGAAGEALALTPGPWLEVIVPLNLEGETGAGGWARYWQDGRPAQAELAAVNRQILMVAGWAGGLGAVVLVSGLGWAFARLRRQADDLARTNRELLLHTKTAAIGAISSHLIHGLKNPLAGLEGFMAEEPGENGGDGEAWREAAATTRRVRGMINEVLAVLQDERDGADYTLTADDVYAAAGQRVEAAVRDAGLTLQMVTVSAEAAPGPEVDGRTAGLVGLVLGNLLDNAIAATPRGGTITLRGTMDAGEALCIDVEDTGGGLPTAVREAQFAPVRSSKTGGAGLGLALSGQLARHAGGALTVVRSDARGTCFRLTVPVSARAKVERSER